MTDLSTAPDPISAVQNQTPEEIALAQYEAEYPEDLKKALIDVTSNLEKQQKTIRQSNIMEWKQLDFYWQGLQNIFFSKSARDWRPYEEGIATGEVDLNENDIGRVINVYRSYGESIIAGLSTTLPGVRFSPDNADDPNDISTAKAYGKIANLIHVHNNSTVLFVKALFTLFNQSFVALYNYYDCSPEYGTIKTPKNIVMKKEVQNSYCPNCGTNVNDAQTIDHEFQGENFQSSVCSTCEQEVIPETETSIEDEIFETYVESPKGREILEVYGPMNIQVPFYVSSLKNAPYLILETEHHISLARGLFPHLANRIKGENAYSSYERWARQPSEAFDTQETDLVTFRRVWLRPWAYYMIKDDIMRQEMQTRYPSGVYFLLLNNLFAEAVEENIDDHWTLSESPTSMYIHAAPLGRPLRDIQDMTNDMYNLTLRTVLYGIPMTFAESNAIDWDKFSESPSEPGMVYPAKVMPGQNLDGMFHTVKTANLSREVDSFSQALDLKGQFVSGAFPSIYGGTMQRSGTYREYESSRNQALQRLSLIWKMLNVWWKDGTFKSCKEYAKHVTVDESYAKRTGEDSFVNVWIKRAELQGKIGEVEAESSDQFPISDMQRRDVMINLLSSPAQAVQQFFSSVVAHPENIGSVTRLLGFGELYIPGNDQRNKQLVENLQLMVSEPIQTGQVQFDQNGQPQFDQNGQPVMVQQSSVPIEEIDDDQIHAETGQAFLVSDVGQYLKDTNPAGYQNVMLHYMEHQQRAQMKAQQQMMQEQANAGGSPQPASASSQP